MSKEQRQEQEREAMRHLILRIAYELVAEKGMKQISIRKIAKRMDYSAGIIYHYFQGKEAIVEQLLQQGYRKLIDGLTARLHTSQNEESAEEKLSQSLPQFIRVTTAEESGAGTVPSFKGRQSRFCLTIRPGGDANGI